jgi:hypothetical protein
MSADSNGNMAGDVARTHPDAIRAATQPLRRGLLALGVAWLATVAFVVPRLGPAEPAIQQVIRAERVEIVEPDGTLAFVLANSQRPEPATIDGQVIMTGQEAERRTPSFIFFDGKGDEVGGMLFRTGPGDGVASRHLSLDGWKQDQTVVLAHYQFLLFHAMATPLLLGVVLPPLGASVAVFQLIMLGVVLLYAWQQMRIGYATRWWTAAARIPLFFVGFVLSHLLFRFVQFMLVFATT